jgi:hypothetical protein
MKQYTLAMRDESGNLSNYLNEQELQYLKELSGFYGPFYMCHIDWPNMIEDMQKFSLTKPGTTFIIMTMDQEDKEESITILDGKVV